MTDTQIDPATAPPAGVSSPIARRLGRVVGAFLVGSVVAPVVAVAAVAVAFGGIAIGVGFFCAAVAVGALLLGAVHRATHVGPRRPALVGSLGWGAGVLLASVALIGIGALAWQQSGREFGGSSTVWWSMSGLGVALVAALCTRGTALPAAVVAVLVAVGAVAVAGVPDSVRSAVGAEDVASSGLSRSLIHVTSISGYGDGQISTDSPGSTIVYLPIDVPSEQARLDGLVSLTFQDPAPTECGRPQNLPFDDLNAAGCEELAAGVFYRSTGRYHEVVVVSPTVVISASGSIDLPEEVLRRAATTARPATDAEVERLYKGWVLDP